MATPITTAEEQLYLEVLENKLTDLTMDVQLQKEILSSIFRELHIMLGAREHSLLQELDGVVTEAKYEVSEKKKHLKELCTARESVQRDITSNKLREIRESNLQALEDKIGEELNREVDVGTVECVWKNEELKERVFDLCKVEIQKERTFRSKDYRLKLSPVWSHESPHNNTPMQMDIDGTTKNIFVIDLYGPIRVFGREGNYLYNIPMVLNSVGVVLTNEFIYASSGPSLKKL